MNKTGTILPGAIVHLEECPLLDATGTSPHYAAYLGSKGEVALLCGITSSPFDNGTDEDKVELVCGNQTGLSVKSFAYPRWIITTSLSVAVSSKYGDHWTGQAALTKLKRRSNARFKARTFEIRKHPSLIDQPTSSSKPATVSSQSRSVS